MPVYQSEYSVLTMSQFPSYFIVLLGVGGLTCEDLFSDYFNWRLTRSPEFGTLIGFKEYNGRLETFTSQRFLEDFSSCQGG